MPLAEHTNVAPTPEDLAATMEQKISLASKSPAALPEEEVVLKPSEMKLRELAGEMDNELLLKDNPGRYVIFPIQHQDVRIVGGGWTCARRLYACFPALLRVWCACAGILCLRSVELRQHHQHRHNLAGQALCVVVQLALCLSSVLSFPPFRVWVGVGTCRGTRRPPSLPPSFSG